jgi:hypothetical protein
MGALSASGCDGRFEFFYLYHSSGRINEILEETAASKNFHSKHPFFMALFAKYQKEALQWFKEAKVIVENHDVLIDAMWAAGMSSDAIHFAQKAGWPSKQIMDLSKNPLPVLRLPIEYNGFLPYMRAYFCVTGETKYISKMIDILDLPQAPHLDKIKKEAEEELFALMYFHDRVYELCVEEATSRKGPAKMVLKSILDQLLTSFKTKTLPEWNGMLNGEVLITDSPSFEEEWDTLPVDSGPIGKSISQIAYPKGGKEIKIIPLFSGIGLDAQLNAHVTYDLEVYDPEGMSVGNWEEKLGLQRAIPSRFLVQAADDFMILYFPDPATKQSDLPADAIMGALGTYKIVVTIKDHIGKKELKITRTLEVLSPEK